MNSDNYVKIVTASEQSGILHNTLYQWCIKGKINDAIQEWGHWFIPNHWTSEKLWELMEKPGPKKGFRELRKEIGNGIQGKS